MMKQVVRRGLSSLGLEVHRARGGLFIYPRPKTRANGEGVWSPPIRLNLGCGPIRLDGFINIDIVETAATDLVANIMSLPMFVDDSVDEVQLDAVYEHLFRHERRSALREWRRILRPGGLLRLSWIPDFDVVADYYVHRRNGFGHMFGLEDAYAAALGNPQPSNAPEQIHKDLFTKDSVRRELEEAGFHVRQIGDVCAPGEDVPWNINVVAEASS